MNIYDFFVDFKVLDIFCKRGYGIIPSTICIIGVKENIEYRIETEINFRVLYNNTCMLCFDDLFLDVNQEEMSIKKFRSQQYIEKTLLQERLHNVLNVIKEKKVKKIKFFRYGDINIILSNRCKIQIINDTHLFNSCIIKISTKELEEKCISNNGNTFYIEREIFKITNGKNNTIIFNTII